MTDHSKHADRNIFSTIARVKYMLPKNSSELRQFTKGIVYIFHIYAKSAIFTLLSAFAFFDVFALCQYHGHKKKNTGVFESNLKSKDRASYCKAKKINDPEI